MDINSRNFTIGSTVRWIKGAIGLTGVVIGFTHVATAPPFDQLVKVDTQKGIFNEYPANLELI